MFRMFISYKWISTVTLVVYAAILMVSVLHVHHLEASSDNYEIQIQAAACCDDHSHTEWDCSLCEFLQSSHSMAESVKSLIFPIQKNEFAVSHQTSANQICFGDAPSRAPPVC